MRKLAIIGLGLMGGSLGLAARQRRAAGIVCGYARREETRRAALARGAVDEAADDPAAAVRDADMAVFCLPVLAIPKAAEACLPGLRAGCILTDVASTKATLAREMTALTGRVGARFVGSHPIAGSDETGMGAARADLYEGAVVAVTPEADSGDARAVDAVCTLWRSVGAAVALMDPSVHDRIVARTSHVPHLVAAMLVQSACRPTPDEASLDLFGNGFRDATRIAAGSEEIWHDIVKTNSAAILDELDRFGCCLDTVKAMIRDGRFDGLRAFLADARQKRKSMRGRD